MSVNTELLIYDKEELVTNLKANGVDDEALLFDMLAECGEIAEDRYYIMDNEYADIRNPIRVLGNLLDSNFAFKGDDCLDFCEVLSECSYEYGNMFIDGEQLAQLMELKYKKFEV